MLDGGTHGVAGHRLFIADQGPVLWERLVGSFGPQGNPGKGTFEPTAHERQLFTQWRKRVLDAGSSEQFPSPGPPRWTWIVAAREEGRLAVIQGGGYTAPEALKDMLTFLSERVDELAAGGTA